MHVGHSTCYTVDTWVHGFAKVALLAPFGVQQGLAGMQGVQLMHLPSAMAAST